jgi:hypothetical protein
MFRARITNNLFRKIMEDIQIFTFQYGPMAKHDTEEARSLFLSAVNTHTFSEESIVREPPINSCVYLVLQ